MRLYSYKIQEAVLEFDNRFTTLSLYQCRQGVKRGKTTPLDMELPRTGEEAALRGMCALAGLSVYRDVDSDHLYITDKEGSTAGVTGTCDELFKLLTPTSRQI